jgi:hypothetical protein
MCHKNHGYGAVEQKHELAKKMTANRGMITCYMFDSSPYSRIWYAESLRTYKLSSVFPPFTVSCPVTTLV